MVQYQPFEFPFKKPPRTLSLSGQTNKNPFVPKDNQLVCPDSESLQRSKSLSVDVYRPIRFD